MKTAKSPVLSQSNKTEPTLSDIIKILKSQDSKLAAISTKLSVQEKKPMCLLLNWRNSQGILPIKERKWWNKISDSHFTGTCTGSDVKTLVREVHGRIEKSNNIVIFNANEEPINNICSPQ